MSLNDQVSAERVHIGFFGLRNAGKSSVVNAVTAQKLSLVSDIPGTTTDPVKKAMELLPIGPVVIIDTPGIDDVGTLGEMRVKRALQILNQTDIAILIVDGTKGLQPADRELLELFKKKIIPYIIVYNKSDLADSTAATASSANEINVSAETGANIYALKELIGHLVKDTENDKRIIADLIEPEDVIVLVVPIDSGAPKGRLILPQQQTIHDILVSGAISMVTRELELPQTLASLAKKPRMVVTDSQAFEKVNRDVPEDIQMTSFSILFARYKGNLPELVRGVAALNRIKDGDRILISEGCTHHRQCDDIGTVKLPRWIRAYTKKNVEFSFSSGNEFPEDLSPYTLVVHCGGCMVNEREMKSRIRHCVDCGVPITNYGTAIAQMHGILCRALIPFPDVSCLLAQT